MTAFIFDLTVSGRGIPTVSHVGLSAHQLRYVLLSRPFGAEWTVRPRDASQPTRKAGGRWV